MSGHFFIYISEYFKKIFKRDILVSWNSDATQ